ncbi:heavy-metal-associated domain-containing protein [Flavihumibacter sp. UBA7668]|uniref:heavy-metal-associated domain-containing protein n=1 Tax=Flavihumibacter sp. UBA7668 TaxID=1946542 RepID=UPI0025BE0421|nr:heavy-metal-associated domain-containing protein [Flavihumibacter sp. UBA7668]
MDKLQFKTTIKCSGCIEKVTPFLNETAGQKNWEVDLQDPAKVLTIPNSENITSASIIKALEDAGYKAEKI